MSAYTTSTGSLGWTVTSCGIDAAGDTTYQWSVTTPTGGSWGYADTQELAVDRAREEYVRLFGEEA